MNTRTRTSKLPDRLSTLASLAALLERLEHEPGSASPLQYRQLSEQITRVLSQTDSDPHLHALLALAPATSQLYENLRYPHAGLCRSPLEQALTAEMAAATAIAKARGTPS
ncbi:MAG: hypothetical protein ABIN96_11465 [Rubrivivax sp.]